MRNAVSAFSSLHVAKSVFAFFLVITESNADAPQALQPAYEDLRDCL